METTLEVSSTHIAKLARTAKSDNDHYVESAPNELHTVYEGPGQKSCTFSGQKPITPCTSALNLMSQIPENGS
jgi:hypothetical protein